MFGNNPKRPPENGDGSILQVQEIFPTFQGEAIFSGHPAVFVRLGGCNLACSFCDTEFESFLPMPLDQILHDVDLKSKNQENIRVINLVVITGGEPFRQPIEKLCEKLLEKGYAVQIETNGTLYRKIDERVSIICSPKNSSKIRPDLLEKITAFKFLVSNHLKEYSFIPNLGQNEHNIPVYLQPMDEYDYKKNNDNLKLAVDLAREFGYRLSLQIHKIAGFK